MDSRHTGQRLQLLVVDSAVGFVGCGRLLGGFRRILRRLSSLAAARRAGHGRVVATAAAAAVAVVVAARCLDVDLVGTLGQHVDQIDLYA